jgi:hypothetical protein
LSYEVQAFKEEFLAMHNDYPGEFNFFYEYYGLSAYPNNPYHWTNARWKSVYIMVVGGEEPSYKQNRS